MIRFPRLAALFAAAVVLLFGSLALAQQGGAAGKPIQPQFPSLPGFWQLRMEHVQKDLELVPEQIEKLKQIGKKYYEEMRAQRGDYQNWGKLTPEERQVKYKEMQEKRKKQAAAIREEVKKVLLPHQLKAIQDINFRSVGPSMLSQPRTAEALGISQEQKAKIAEVRKEMMENYRQMQKESFEKILGLLTPEQREKLKEQIQHRGY